MANGFVLSLKTSGVQIIGGNSVCVKLPDLGEEFEHVFVNVKNSQLLFLWFSIRSAG